MSDVLDTAVQHHQQGRLQQAESLYRQVLRDEPGNAEARHLLGLLAHQVGHHQPAERMILEAIGANPRKALYHFNLGVVRTALDDPAGAERAYRKAVSVQPDYADAHNNLGLLLEKRDEAAALDCFRQAVRHAPRHAEAQVNLGRRLLARNEPEAARGCFERALALEPGLAEALFGLGKCAEEQGRWAEAEELYRQALAARPNFSEARNNLAAVFLAQGEYGRAQAAFGEVVRRRHGTPPATAAALREDRAEDRDQPAAPAEGPAQATRFLLLDRIQQLDWLLADGRIDPSFREIADLYREVLDEMDARKGSDEAGFDWRRPLDAAQDRRIGRFLNRFIHYRDAPRLAGPAVNPDTDFARLEAAYLSSPAPAESFDDFLTPAALAGLRRFCRDSTIFFGADPAGYVSAYLADGFNCSLMYQIAEELKQRMPRVLGPHYLSNMWAYRHVAASAGVTAHTDLAAVTFNFWITPEAANLDPQSGGLILYKKEEPFDWDWMEVNKKKNAPYMRERIRRHLESAERLVIPYRGNRAVLFHSNLFHESDRIHFRDGFDHRRVNVSLLFGRRGARSGFRGPAGNARGRPNPQEPEVAARPPRPDH